MKHRLHLLVLVCIGLIVGACATLKSVARTADDVAGAMCSAFFSEKMGISAADAAEKFCKTREQLEPFVQEWLKLKQQGMTQGFGVGSASAAASSEAPPAGEASAEPESDPIP